MLLSLLMSWLVGVIIGTIWTMSGVWIVGLLGCIVTRYALSQRPRMRWLYVVLVILVMVAGLSWSLSRLHSWQRVRDDL